MLYPVVVDDYRAYPALVAYYREQHDLPLLAQFSHAGFHASWLGPMVVLSAPEPGPLRVPRQVNAIFVVDDLDAFWRKLEPVTETLVALWGVPTGRAFVVRHGAGDGRVIEYLQLASP